MKKIILLGLGVMLFLLPVCAGVFLEGAPFYSATLHEEMLSAGADSVPVTARSQKVFARIFPQAKNTRWLKMPGATLVFFDMNGNHTNAVLSKKGVFRYSVQEMRTANIPMQVQQEIHRRYPGYSFFNTKEIRNTHSSGFYMVIENKKEFLSLLVNDDGVDELNRLSKYPTEK